MQLRATSRCGGRAILKTRLCFGLIALAVMTGCANRTPPGTMLIVGRRREELPSRYGYDNSRVVLHNGIVTSVQISGTLR